MIDTMYCTVRELKQEIVCLNRLIKDCWATGFLPATENVHAYDEGDIPFLENEVLDLEDELEFRVTERKELCQKE